MLLLVCWLHEWLLRLLWARLLRVLLKLWRGVIATVLLHKLVLLLLLKQLLVLRVLLLLLHRVQLQTVLLL